MRIEFLLSSAELNKFANACEATILSVGNGTKTGTIQACEEILADSLEQVPRDTGTLASTAFYKVSRRADTKSYRYEGVVGYAGEAGQGATYDAVNPKSGERASSYAIKVHEDVNMYHPRGGKAKFLEDPVRAYGARKFARVAERHWKAAITRAGTTLVPKG